jgi:predicted DNA-binding transcriptional regulator AlpA
MSPAVQAPDSPRDVFPLSPESRISLHEVAALFGRSPVTVRAWIRDGVLPPPIRIGAQRFWDRSVLSEYLRHRGGTDAPAPVAREGLAS